MKYCTISVTVWLCGCVSARSVSIRPIDQIYQASLRSVIWVLIDKTRPIIPPADPGRFGPHVSSYWWRHVIY